MPRSYPAEFRRKHACLTQVQPHRHSSPDGRDNPKARRYRVSLALSQDDHEPDHADGVGGHAVRDSKRDQSPGRG